MVIDAVYARKREKEEKEQGQIHGRQMRPPRYLLTRPVPYRPLPCNPLPCPLHHFLSLPFAMRNPW